MVVYHYGLHNRPTFKQRIRPALGDHRQIYQNGALYTAKENEQKGRRLHKNIREGDLETALHTGCHNL
jgi:hypothetical protein